MENASLILNLLSIVATAGAVYGGLKGSISDLTRRVTVAENILQRHADEILEIHKEGIRK